MNIVEEYQTAYIDYLSSLSDGNTSDAQTHWVVCETLSTQHKVIKAMHVANDINNMGGYYDVNEIMIEVYKKYLEFEKSFNKFMGMTNQFNTQIKPQLSSKMEQLKQKVEQMKLSKLKLEQAKTMSDNTEDIGDNILNDTTLTDFLTLKTEYDTLKAYITNELTQLKNKSNESDNIIEDDVSAMETNTKNVVLEGESDLEIEIIKEDKTNEKKNNVKSLKKEKKKKK